mgnify:FL=1
MRESKIDYLKQKLLQRGRELQYRIDTFKEQSEIDYNNGKELSMYDNHPAEIASETYEIEKNIALNQHQVKQFKDIQESLKNIDKGTYGICQVCGGEIPFERLNAMPTSKMCISCQEGNTMDLKDSPDRNIRPIEEEAFYPPFGRTNLDDTDYVAYDGEDAWQDVARYNKTENVALDWYDNNLYDEEKVDKNREIENITNRQYKDQLPDS